MKRKKTQKKSTWPISSFIISVCTLLQLQHRIYDCCQALGHETFYYPIQATLILFYAFHFIHFFSSTRLSSILLWLVWLTYEKTKQNNKNPNLLTVPSCNIISRDVHEILAVRRLLLLSWQSWHDQDQCFKWVSVDDDEK